MIKKSGTTVSRSDFTSRSARAAYRRSYFKINATRYAGIRNGILNKHGK